MSEIDWLFWWKIVSIFMTGGFGILALLTKYKDDQGQITQWGKVSLGGILLSTVLGAAAQVKESTDKESASRKQRDQMFEVIKNTQSSIVGIERTLDKLEELTAVNITFLASCTEHWKEVCALARTAQIFDVLQFPPGSRADLRLTLSKDEQAKPPGDWVLIGSFDDREGRFSARLVNNEKDVEVVLFMPVRQQVQKGRFKSFLDLPGARVYATLSWYRPTGLSTGSPLRVQSVSLIFRNMRTFEVERIVNSRRSYYEGKIIAEKQ